MAKSKAYKCTNQHFEMFKQECQYWIDRIGLKDYSIMYTFEQWKDGKYEDSYACAAFSTEDRLATVNLTPEWVGLKPDHYRICWCAFHEICELWLGDLRDWIDLEVERQLDTFIHRLVREMENAFFLPDYASRYPVKKGRK
jgi:hypothetical protein